MRYKSIFFTLLLATVQLGGSACKDSEKPHTPPAPAKVDRPKTKKEKPNNQTSLPGFTPMAPVPSTSGNGSQPPPPPPSINPAQRKTSGKKEPNPSQRPSKPVERFSYGFVTDEERCETELVQGINDTALKRNFSAVCSNAKRVGLDWRLLAAFIRKKNGFLDESQIPTLTSQLSQFLQQICRGDSIEIQLKNGSTRSLPIVNGEGIDDTFRFALVSAAAGPTVLVRIQALLSHYPEGNPERWPNIEKQLTILKDEKTLSFVKDVVGSYRRYLQESPARKEERPIECKDIEKA